jgi:hypothetical protein
MARRDDDYDFVINFMLSKCRAAESDERQCHCWVRARTREVYLENLLDVESARPNLENIHSYEGRTVARNEQFFFGERLCRQVIKLAWLRVKLLLFTGILTT